MPGYELGVTDNGKDFFIFNHLVFNVLVHKTDGRYTRAQNSAYTASLAVDASRRLLAWPEGTPDDVVAAFKTGAARRLRMDGDDDKESEKVKEKRLRKEKLQRQQAARVRLLLAFLQGLAWWPTCSSARNVVRCNAVLHPKLVPHSVMPWGMSSGEPAA